jgi:hypothetical protein
MDENLLNKPTTYCIRVKETLDRQFADWLDDLAILPQENGETLLVSAFQDQPALRGFLDQLWNLNITVITVERIENAN